MYTMRIKASLTDFAYPKSIPPPRGAGAGVDNQGHGYGFPYSWRSQAIAQNQALSHLNQHRSHQGNHGPYQGMEQII